MQMDKRIQILCRRREAEGAGLLGVATKLQNLLKPSLPPEHLREVKSHNPIFRPAWGHAPIS